MAILEAAGYRCTRSAASLGMWDVVGIGPTDIVVVQVRSRDYPGPVERRELAEFPCPPNCKKLLHRWRKRARVPDVMEL